MTEVTERLGEIILDYPNVYDPPNIHHEFKDGGHGRKLDLEALESNGRIYQGLIYCMARAIEERYNPLPNVLIGLANGGSRFADDLAVEIDGEVESLGTKKEDSRSVFLTYSAHQYLKDNDPEFVLLIDDVGTTGKTIRPVVKEVKYNNKDRRVEAFFAWQRQPQLRYLDYADIVYDSLIKIFLPTYPSEDECRQGEGYCARGVKLVRR
jgi:hypoxanthine phosphoribosyltransferase